LYQVEPVVWTSITTSRVVMRLVHATCKTSYKIYTTYVISLSNISIKTNFIQITRFELKLTHLYNTLRETTFCAWRHVICCSTFTNVSLLFDHFQCHCTIVRQCFFLEIFLEMWTVQWKYVLGNESIAILNMNEWTLNNRALFTLLTKYFGREDLVQRRAILYKCSVDKSGLVC